MEHIHDETWKFTSKANNFYSSELKDLVEKLLEKDQDKRLGAISDMEEILEHSAFKIVPTSPDMSNLKPVFYDLYQNYLENNHRKLVS